MADCSSLGTLISKGTYGSIYKRDSSVLKVFEECDSCTGVPQDCIKEISLLNSLCHPNIVCSSGALLIPAANDKSLPRPACVLELALGSLQDYMYGDKLSKFIAMPQGAVIAAMSDMWAGLQYLHENGIVHRDIKPPNLLVFNGSAPGSIRVKIADFGTALVHMPSGVKDRRFDAPRTDPVTSLWYRSPEAAFSVNTSHGPAMDVWAAGLITCEAALHMRYPIMYNVTVDRYENSNLTQVLCERFGTPTVGNGLMPSYFVEYGATALPPYKFLHAPKTPSEAIFRGKGPSIAWENFVMLTLCLEPTRRITAACAFDQILGVSNVDSGLEFRIPDQVLRTSAVQRQEVSPALGTAPEFAHARKAMGRLVHFIATYRNTDSSRRAFHTATAILDRVLGVTEFADRALRGNREMVKLCFGISCVASKMCGSMRVLEPEFIRENQRKLGLWAAPLIPQWDPLITADEIFEAELYVLQMLDWRAWFTVPYDVAMPNPTKNSHFDYTRDYYVDVMCMSGISCGMSPTMVDETAATIAMMALDEIPEERPDLIEACLKEARECNGSFLHTFYATDKRYNVSTKYQF